MTNDGKSAYDTTPLQRADAALDAAREARAAAREAHSATYREWIKANAPVKAGDVIEWDGYSNKGKRVRLIGVWTGKDWIGGHEWVVRGVVLKNDGSESLNRVDGRFRIDHRFKIIQPGGETNL